MRRDSGRRAPGSPSGNPTVCPNRGSGPVLLVERAYGVTVDRDPDPGRTLYSITIIRSDPIAPRHRTASSSGPRHPNPFFHICLKRGTAGHRREELIANRLMPVGTNVGKTLIESARHQTYSLAIRKSQTHDMRPADASVACAAHRMFATSAHPRRKPSGLGFPD